MISETCPLVLGSASPRRRDLLSQLGLPLAVLSADIDESPLPEERALPYLDRIVMAKLRAVVSRLQDREGAGEPWAALLVADTTVVLEEEIVGKPAGLEQAYRTVRKLSGRAHEVMTRYAIVTASDVRAAGQRRQLVVPTIARTVESGVWLRQTTEQEARRYANSGEGLDKAGAYAVQGIGSFLVERIAGSYTNVVGLPVCEVVQDLQSLELVPEFPQVAAVETVDR